MPRIAITGHMDLTPDTVSLVYRAIGEALAEHADSGELVGVSCIAKGADSTFAEAVLDAGGRLEVILPAANYRERKVGPDHAVQFDKLVERATEIRALPFPEPNRVAYEAANEALIASCDRLMAVWDGMPSKKGGTATVVEFARSRHIPVDVIWPAGSARTR